MTIFLPWAGMTHCQRSPWSVTKLTNWPSRRTSPLYTCGQRGIRTADVPGLDGCLENVDVAQILAGPSVSIRAHFALQSRALRPLVKNLIKIHRKIFV